MNAAGSRSRRGPAALAIFVVATLGLATTVHAHANLLSIDPPDGSTVDVAPPAVTLTFDESVAADGAAVYDHNGAVVSDSATASDGVVTIDLPAGLGDGTYLVSWRIISADSHPIVGSSTFHVGAPSETVVDVPTATTPTGVRAARAALAALMYGSVLVSIGMAWFGRRWRSDVGDAVQRIARLSAWVAVAAVVALVPVRTVELSGSWPAAWDLDEIRPVLAGPVGLSLALVGIGSLALALTVRGREVWRRVSVAGGALAVFVGLLAEGHTRSADPRWLVVAGDAVHVVGAAVWLGGVAALATVIARRAAVERSILRSATVDVSSHAIVAVVAVTAAGIAMTLAIMPGFEALLETRWGAMVLAKIALVALLVALGWYNRFRLLPRLDSDDVPVAERRLRQTLAAELALFAAVAVATGVLVGSTPNATTAAESPPRAFHETVALTSGAGEVVFDLHPATVGTNDLSLVIVDSTGEPLELAVDPTVELRELDRGIGPIAPQVHPVGGGAYHVVLDLTFPGTWQIEANVRTGEFETGRATVALPID